MFTSAAVQKHDWRSGERRSCHREPLQWAVLVFFGDNWGKLIDLSERGMSFQFAHPPALNEPITFTFEAMGCMPLPGGKVFGDSVQATGQVVWAQEFERTAGVQFLELSPKSRDQIRHWMSSAPGQEVQLASKEPQEELTEEWSREWNNEANREAAEARAAFAVEEPDAPFAEAPDESLTETSEGELESLDSEAEAPWEPEPAFAPPSLDEPSISDEAQFPQEPEYGFEPREPDHPAHETGRPEKISSAFARLGLGASAPNTDGLWEPTSDPAAQESLSDDPRGPWQSESAPDAEKVEPSFGFNIPPRFLEHEERQRRGQTLILRQRRSRVGSLAVLSFLVSVGAVAGIISFISKFSERPEVAASTSQPLPGKADSSRVEDRGLTASTTPFLVEVLDANHRRSVLWFSSPVRQNTTARISENSAFPATLASAKQAPGEESVSTAAKQGEPSHDFSLVAPHTSGSVTNDSPQSSTALAAPAMPADVPVPAEVPLQTAMSSPTIPAPVEQTLPLGGSVQPARLIHATLPEYPQMARTSRVLGDVTLDALIDASGNVKDVKVISGPVLLREAAKQALRQWKYEPARLDGQPTAIHLTVTLKFQNNPDSH